MAFLDVSERGVQLLTTEAMKKGDEVEVVLEGYGMRAAIRRMGEVRWIVAVDTETGGFRVGIQFNRAITFREVQNLSNP